MLRAVQIFRCGVGALLLMAAGCAPVRDELFMVEPPPPAGTGATPIGGNMSPPQAGLGGMMSSSGNGATTITFGGEGGSDPRLNPRANFDWTETIPGGGGCEPATFTGTFSCKLEGGLNVEVLEGAITLVLSGSSEAQMLTVEERSQLLVFDSSMKMLLLAPVVGTLSCNTQQLVTDVLPKITEPLGIDRQFLWLTGIPQPTVSGTLKGSLDRTAQSIEGNLELEFEPGPKCTGTFNVRAAPNVGAMP